MMAQIQNERKERVRSYCRSHQIDDSFSDGELTGFLADEKHKVLYCVIFKVSSKWLKNMMRTVGGQRFRSVNSYTPEERTKILQTYFKFMFVRQPLDRLLSAFINKLYYVRDPLFRHMWGRKILKLYRPNATEEDMKNGDNIAYDEFAQFVLDGHRDPHWAHYHERCHPCTIQYDFIGQFESFTDELPYLFEAAGIEDPPEIEREYVTSNTSTKVRSYYSQLPVDRIRGLAEKYRADYEMFGYPFPGQVIQELIEELEGA